MNVREAGLYTSLRLFFPCEAPSKILPSRKQVSTKLPLPHGGHVAAMAHPGLLPPLRLFHHLWVHSGLISSLHFLPGFLSGPHLFAYSPSSLMLPCPRWKLSNQHAVSSARLLVRTRWLLIHACADKRSAVSLC